MTADAGVVWLDGEVVAADEARVSALDRGLLYGDGVFETIRVYGGAPFRLGAHIDRLAAGARALGIRLTHSAEDLRVAVVETPAAGGLADAYVRITVTRGVGGAPGDLNSTPAATVMILARPFHPHPPELAERGARAQLSTVRRNDTSPLCNLKTLNYLDNLLARAQAREAGFDEAIMLNTRGNVAEGTASNLFIVRAGDILTPPVSDGVLPGITRAAVMAIADAREESFAPDDLLGADEAFLTNSLIEVLPLVGLDDAAIGPGVPGPVTLEIAAAYRSLVAAECRRDAR